MNCAHCTFPHEFNFPRITHLITGNQGQASNWAFIDTQNLYKGVYEGGWKLDWKKFREYLQLNLQVSKAVLFLGYLREYNGLYRKIKKAGFELQFRQVRRLSNGIIDGGNVDADLASFTMDHKDKYHQAVIVADDADYTGMIRSLDQQQKLKLIISSHPINRTSALVKQAVGKTQLISIHSIRNLVA